MADKENSFDMTDWELSEEYYKENEENKELKLEDFMLPEDKIPSASSDETQDPALARTISDVQQVLSVYGEGKSVEEIALALSLEADYVHTILYCAQGFSEDDPIAVARLVMMS